MQITHRYPIYVAALACIFVGVFPSLARATYTQPYYESYYESYYQTYYQSTYTRLSGNVKFAQSLLVSGTLSKGSGTFVIDHPLDPANKLLYHSFVESPDVKNLYDGVVILGSRGEAIVQLPSYFSALNESYRYQLKSIGVVQPNLHVKKEIEGNVFVIGGGESGEKVSWQVTGIRHDPYIKAHPIIVEVEKGEGQIVQKGEFLHDRNQLDTLPIRALMRRWLGGVSEK